MKLHLCRKKIEIYDQNKLYTLINEKTTLSAFDCTFSLMQISKKKLFSKLFKIVNIQVKVKRK